MLRTFSPDETKNFEKFLLSPFFNTSKTYVKFYKELIRFYPDFKDEKLTAEYIFGKMFGGKQFHKQTMWNLSSGLEKLAEEFLIHASLAKNHIEKFKLIFKVLENKRLDKLYLKKINEMENVLRSSGIDSKYFASLGELEEYKISYWQKLKGLQKHFSENVIESAGVKTLDYLANILEILNDVEYFKFESSVTGQQHKAIKDFITSIDFKKMIDAAASNKYKYSGLIEFYCNSILCVLYPEKEEYFYKVKKYFFDNHKLFGINEMSNIVTFLGTYCVIKNLYGNSNFHKELFGINKFRLKHGLAVNETGIISKSLYIQIAGNAAVLKEVKWFEKFIEKYTPLLLKEHQKTAKNLARAALFYHVKKYKSVLDLLNKIDFVDIVDKINVKHLIARTYYELKDFESLLYYIDAALHFLRNNKNISSYISEVNSKFFNSLHSLVIAAEKNDLSGLSKLEEKIKKDSALTGRRWLLEKISEAVQKA